MPENNTPLDGFSKEVENKLRVFDEALSEGIKIESRSHLRDFLNRNRLKNESSITESRAAQIVKILKDLVKEDTNGEVKIKTSRHGGYYYTKPRYRYFKDFVYRHEENLLLMANNLFEMFPGTALHENFGFVVDKIFKTKSRKGEIKFKNLNLIEISGTSIDKGIKWINDIIEAMIEKKAIKIEYKNDIKIKPKTKVLSPYILKQHESKWYLVAFDHTSNYSKKTNVFTLSKIEALYTTEITFKEDPYFSAKDYFKYSIGIWHRHENDPIKVRIEVLDNDTFLRLKNDPIHKTQVTISEADKLLEIEVYDTPELEKLILKYGPLIKIISPDSLVQKIKIIYEKLFTLYN